MKRSAVNETIAWAIDTAKRYGVGLPPFASWTPEQFGKLNQKEEAIRASLGWIVVDFGQGDFLKCGLTILVLSAPTVDSKGCPITDSEKLGYPPRFFSRKLLFLKAGQSEPHHYHREKKEKEVSLLAGGPIEFQLAWSTEDSSLSNSDVIVRVDGICHTTTTKDWLKLMPGQTISLSAGLSHVFRALGNDVILQETSTSNNDKTDNYFPLTAIKGNPIEEDEFKKFTLISDHAVSLASAV